MQEVDKGCLMTRTGVSGWMFLLVPAYPGSPGPKAVKQLCVVRVFNSRPAVVVDPYPCLATVWRHWTLRLVTHEISSAVPTPHTSDSQNTRKINAMTKCAALVSEYCNRSEQQTWGPIYKISYDYLTIMRKLRSTYDRRLIHKTSCEGSKAFLGYNSLANSSSRLR